MIAGAKKSGSPDSQASTCANGLDKPQTGEEPPREAQVVDCDCPPGAWHLRSCTAVYWPEHMREDALLDERETA